MVAVIIATSTVLEIVFMGRSFAWEPVKSGMREPRGRHLFMTLREHEELVRLVRKGKSHDHDYHRSDAG